MIAASLAVLVALGPLPERMVPAQLVWGVASGAWVIACAFVRRGAGRTWLVIAGAVALRAIALAGDPALSDDVPRYVWEGGLVCEGRSPYAHAPADPALAEVRERWSPVYERVNHPEVSAAYPPLAQLSMAAAVALSGGPAVDGGRRAERFLRVLFALCDLAVVGALMGCLRAFGRDPCLAVVWAWCPLVVLEFAGVGHFDSLGILLLVAALWAWKRGAGRAAAALCAAGGLVKLLPFAALPWVLRGRQLGGRLLAALGTVVVGAGWLLLLEEGAAGLGAGIGEYGLRWESGSLVYRFVERVFPGGWARDESLTDPRVAGRVVAGAVLALLVLVEWRRRADPVQAVRVLVRGFLVVTPTLHPWYVCWSVPFLALAPSRAWTLLVALAPLLYWPLARWRADGVWEEPAWLWAAVAVPFFTCLAFEWAAARRAPAGRTPPRP